VTKLRYSPALLATLDSLTAFGLAVAAVVWVNNPHIAKGGLATFLRIRVTLLNLSFAVVFAILWKQCLSLLGLYSRELNGLRRLLLRTATACAAMTAVLALYLQARHARGPIAEILVDFLIAAFMYETCRVMVCSRHVSWNVSEPERVLILGSGRLASKAWRELRMQHQRNRKLMGFIDDRPLDCMPPDIASRFIGTVDDLPAYLVRNVVDELIIATPLRSCYDLSQRALSIAEAAGVRVVCLQDVFALTQQSKRRRRPSLFIEMVPRSQRRVTAETAKRMLDVFGAVAGILLFAPVFLVISLAIKLTSSGSIFSVQERHGYGRRRFRMFRFRSVAGASASGTAPDHNPPAMTALGKFLRRTLLDELPELWNVLLGDMSLVGPQPMSADEVTRVDQAHFLRRFSVRPGITGNWQVAMLPTRDPEEWAALDSSYLDDWSLTLDLKILARTVPALFKRTGNRL
jgi:lipopolysaccharide/colanic/teichoic acid biosynthesis glycosyltransferase